MTASPTYSLAQLGRYCLKLGAIGCGGPAALVGYMYRDLVEERRWIAEEDDREGLALAQLMPGPLASAVTRRAPSAKPDNVRRSSPTHCAVR